MSLGFIFSGQGAQKVGMGKSLFEESSVAREVYERADARLGWSLSEVSFEGPQSELTQTRICQPALFVAGYAVFELLKHSGHAENPGAAAGLSLGELTALTAAEAFDFETGLAVVAERGRLMQEACDQSAGAMASMIGGELSAVEDIASEFDVDIANLNCPGQIVISGEKEKIEQAVSAAQQSNHFRMVVPLDVAGAYHSRLMEPARAKFEAYLANIEIQEPKFPVFTNVTGQRVQTADEIRENLVKQVVSSVRWEDCMRAMANLGITQYYECGPGAVLAGLARRTDRSLKVTPVLEFADLPQS